MPAKAQFMLIEAVSILQSRGRGVTLTLVVRGRSARLIVETPVGECDLGNEIRLVGACNHDRVSGFYQPSDTFVLGSFAEGVPVLLEAMAMELPCIGTWIAGIPELIDNGVDGLPVAPADPAALPDAVVCPMDDPAVAQRLGAAGRQKVVAKYRLERNTERLGDGFRRLLAIESSRCRISIRILK